jgi:hypothetical protein
MPRIWPACWRTFVQRLRDLHAAALAAAAGVDLRLHHPDLAAEFLGRLDRLVDGKAGDAARRGDPEFPQDLLALVFMDFHAISLLVDAEEGMPHRRRDAESCCVFG